MMRRSWLVRSSVGLSLVAASLALPAPAAAQDLGSNVNGLMAFDFSSHYITPRGLNVEDDGIVGQPLLLVFWKLHGADAGPVSEVTLTTGVWNSFHSQRSGLNPSRWNEIDPILGLTVKFRNKLVVDSTATAFYTPTASYATSAHLDVKLTYNDSGLPGFSLNPYVAYWAELKEKATVVFDPDASSRGSYVTLGATPTFPLPWAGAAVDVGTYVNLVSGDFYQRFDGADGGAGLAVLSVAPKISMPLPFLGITHGAWTAYAGASYYHLRNDGLLDGNQVLGSADRQSNLVRVRGGLTVFF